MWELWNPAMGVSCTPLKGMPIMPASSSVMPWEIGGYWGMGHFQNNGAAGGLDLRHRSSFPQSINCPLLLMEVDMVVYFPYSSI